MFAQRERAAGEGSPGDPCQVAGRSKLQLKSCVVFNVSHPPGPALLVCEVWVTTPASGAGSVR